MKSLRIAMSIDDFRSFPRKLGWRYEYTGGIATITPRHNIVVAKVSTANVDAEAGDSLGSSESLVEKRVSREDLFELTELFTASFGDAVEYCDVDQGTARESGRSSLQGYFDGLRGPPLEISTVRVDESGAAAAAALFVETGLGALLDLLMVHPHFHRRGFATTLVAAVARELSASDVEHLFSCYRLANDPSSTWHRRFGFVDEPDLQLAQEKRDHYRHELERRVRSGLISLEERTRLEAEIFRWQSEVSTLETHARQNGQESVAPFLRLRSATSRPSRA